MRMRAFAAGAAAAAALVLAGCGTDERVVNVTVTTHTGVTTPTVPATDTGYTTPTTPTTDDGTTPLELRLPPSRTIDGMGSGEVKRMQTAREMVTALFAAGDPGVATATARLNAAGYEDGYFRDQQGTASGAPTLVRTYAMRLRDDGAAAGEVVAATDEVARCELVGLVPRSVLEAVAPSRWGELDLAPDRTIEARWESGVRP